MSLSEDIGRINDAGLKAAQVAAEVEQASKVLDTAVSLIDEIRRTINEVQGNFNSARLTAYVEALNAASASIRRSQNSNVEAILHMNHGENHGREFVNLLHG